MRPRTRRPRARDALVRVLLAAAAIAAGPTAAAAQALPTGYRIRVADQAADLRLVQDQPSAFHAMVVRRAATAEGERFLRIAESLYPPRDAVVARGTSCAEVDATEHPWTASCSLEPRMPHALTASAVRFHLDRIAAYRRGDFQGLTRPLRTGAMRYEAAGEWLPAFELEGRRFTDVHVVRLSLTWRIRNGPEWYASYSFTKDRIVVFSRGGDVLAVHGDGPTPLAVS